MTDFTQADPPNFKSLTKKMRQYTYWREGFPLGIPASTTPRGEPSGFIRLVHAEPNADWPGKNEDGEIQGTTGLLSPAPDTRGRYAGG